MKTSDIYMILTDEFEKVRDVFNKYNSEFEEYQRQISKKGASIYLKIEEDKKFIFNREHLFRLGKLFINDIINELELCFIVDCILFSIDNFENDLVMEELECLTDPEVNGHLTKEFVRKLVMFQS